MTRSDVLALVYRFYARGMVTCSPGYNDTAERHRQLDATRVGVAE